MIIALGGLNWSTEGGRWEATVGIPEVARMDHQQQAQRCVISQDMEGNGGRGGVGVGEDGWHSSWSSNRQYGLNLPVLDERWKEPIVIYLYNCIINWGNAFSNGRTLKKHMKEKQIEDGESTAWILQVAIGSIDHHFSLLWLVATLRGGSSCLNSPPDFSIFANPLQSWKNTKSLVFFDQLSSQ